MSESYSKYKEDLLQWIWKNRKFRQFDLHLLDGSFLEILDTGVLNPGSGPDFTAAKLRINDLLWHGDIEIHTDEENWFAHHHHLDSGFNSVVLHVVFNLSPNGKRAFRKDGTEPLTFHMAPTIQKPLHQLLNNRSQHGIECSGKISFISQEIFQKQVQKANREYFSFKADELMSHYDPLEKPSDAWKKMFIISLYAHLGIPRNREVMAVFAKRILDDVNLSSSGSISEFIKHAKNLAHGDGFQNKWIVTGMRPASRPSVRIKQATALHYLIHQTPISEILTKGATLWDHWRNLLCRDNQCGSETDNMLKHTVFYPSLFILGKLFFSNHLIQSSFNAWKKGNIRIPASVIKEFEKAGFDLDAVHRNAGLIHQYKRYCCKRRCTECKVFKKAILS